MSANRELFQAYSITTTDAPINNEMFEPYGKQCPCGGRNSPIEAPTTPTLFMEFDGSFFTIHFHDGCLDAFRDAFLASTSGKECLDCDKEGSTVDHCAHPNCASKKD